MPARTVTYYIIDDPLKEGRTAACSLRELKGALMELEEGAKIRRVVKAPRIEGGEETHVEAFEKSLKEKCGRESGRISGWVNFFRIGVGLTVTYLAFPTLFSFGSSLPFRMFGPWRGPLPPELAVGTYILGFIFALIPYAAVHAQTLRRSARSKELRKVYGLIGRLGEADLETVESEPLASFLNEFRASVEGARRGAKRLAEAKGLKEKIEACELLITNLERMFRGARIHKLKGLDEFYHELQASFYSLRIELEEAKPWRNYGKLVERVLASPLPCP